jgi:two-component system response regulator RegA
VSTESRTDPPASLELADSDPPAAAYRSESRTAIYVYGRTTLALACPAPICLQAFLGPVPDVHFDAGSHSITVEPGVYLVCAGHAVEVTGDDIDVVAIVDGRPARRTPRRLARVMPSLKRRALARFLRRPAPAPRPRRQIRRILAVDEDTAATSRYARGFGPDRTVLEAADPATARELARSGPLDLAIVELRIRHESGIELARELRRDHPDLVIALCSGYLSVEAAVTAVRAGIDIVLFKPVTAQDILRRIGAATGEPEPDPDTEKLEHAEWEHITRVLADCGGNISMAADRLGIYRSSLQRRLRRCSPGSAGRASPAPGR